MSLDPVAKASPDPPTVLPGTRFGPYEIAEPIGAGGMGEVYRARDTKLGRDVAVKALPAELARDRERVSRFEREARILATLNHPNISSIYGLEESDGRHVLVLELVEGETLAERIARDPIPIADALPLFRQIAAGLEAAHDKGIVHRDLKPANVKVTPEGLVKVLDFGLAKAFRDEASDSEIETASVPASETREGRVLGTVGYMSPEQARGQPVDKRTDIWAFGCCLYETLAGRRAFAGETRSDTLAAVLERDVDWAPLPASVPPSVRALLRRCLRKDRDRRLHDIADARIEIEEAIAEPEAKPETGQSRWRRALPWSIAAFVTIAAIVVLNVWRPPARATSRSITHLVFPVESGQQLSTGPSSPLAISPDGSRIVYVGQPLGGAASGGRTQLYLRDPDAFHARPIPGTERAQSPFFSPNGQWVGFHAAGTLLKVSVDGGAPQRICDASWALTGAVWGPDDDIFFSSPYPSGIHRVSAAGGNPERVTTPDLAGGEVSHGYPQILPGGKDVLFSLNTRDGGRAALLSLATGHWRVLNELGGAGGARYLPTGHVVYSDGASLMVVDFDIEQLETKGRPTPVLQGVRSEHWTGFAVPYFALSENGTLVYVPGGDAPLMSRLVWVDREGRATPVSDERSRYRHPRLSPDGVRLAVTMRSKGGADVWLHDIERGTRSRLTVGGNNIWPVWTPDGGRVAFASNRSGSHNLYWTRADGSGEPEPLLERDGIDVYPFSWSRDGAVLALSTMSTGQLDIWTLPLDGRRSPVHFAATPFNETAPRFSPDGQWIAYSSDETGRSEVYARPYPGPGEKTPISTGGGTAPVWSDDGKELFYREESWLMVVDISTAAGLVAGAPRRLFEGYELNVHGGPNYDVSRDGKRVLMVESDPAAAPTQLNVVLGWLDQLAP